ncbi:MAG: response regulator [Alphaproteobacteria bacterium]|nr:response regulator [Alphaproteobacteria bacterium]
MNTALIVDDSRTVRRFARNALESLGFNCQEAENGLVALAACRAEMPDLVLLDWEMPVLDGLGFAVALRAEPGGETPKILFCTTHSDLNDIERALAAGSDEYVMKPFDREIIELKLRDLGLVT